MQRTVYSLIDVYRDRLEFPRLKRKIIEMKANLATAHVLIEDAGSGKGLIQQLRYDRDMFPIAITAETSKIERMASASAVIEAGRVLLPRSAPWLDALRIELSAFPLGRHDDQVDSVSQFLNWITLRKPPGQARIRRL